MRHFTHLIIAVLITLTLGACGNDNQIQITGRTLEDKDITFRVVVYTPRGVRTEVLATRQQQFAYIVPVDKDDNGHPYFIELYTHDYKPLGAAMAYPGDKIDLKIGAGINSYQVTADGNPAAEQYAAELSKYLADNPADNGAVARYIDQNPRSPIAYTLLSLLYDTTDNLGEAYRLYQAIDPDTRPLYYDNTFATAMTAYGRQSPRIDKFEALCIADTIFRYDPADYKATIIAYTAGESQRTDSVINLLRQAARQYRDVAAIEHNLANDTLSWHRAIKQDAKQIRIENADNKSSLASSYAFNLNPDDIKLIDWISIWTGAGPASPVADRIDITSLPYYTVADNSGKIRYSGPSAAQANQTLRDILPAPNKQ